MDDEEKRDDEEVGLADGILDDALETDDLDEEEAVDPLSVMDAFGGGDDFDGKQWE